MKVTKVEFVVGDVTRHHKGENWIETSAEVTALQKSTVIGQPMDGMIEGSLTFRNFKLQPGQRIAAEFHILDPEPKVRRDFHTNEPITD